MSCNHLPSVTCDECQHVRSVPIGTPMSLNQAAWSAGWAEGYQAGMRFAAEANESEIERLKTDRDRLREQLSKVLGALSDAIDLCEEGWGMQGVNLDYDKRADSLCAAYANGLRSLGLGSDDE